MLIHLLILPCLIEDGLELFVVLGSKLFLRWLVRNNLVQALAIIIISLACLQKKSLLVAMLSIIWMRLLILANICLPAQIGCVNC